MLLQVLYFGLAIFTKGQDILYELLKRNLSLCKQIDFNEFV